MFYFMLFNIIFRVFLLFVQNLNLVASIFLLFMFIPSLRKGPFTFIIAKGSVHVSLRDLPCKDGKARVTTVHVKALSDQVWIRYPWVCLFELFGFMFGFSKKCISSIKDTMEKLSELTFFEVRKTILSSTLLIRIRFQGSIQITLTVPWRHLIIFLNIGGLCSRCGEF